MSWLADLSRTGENKISSLGRGEGTGRRDGTISIRSVGQEDDQSIRTISNHGESFLSYILG